MTRYDCTAIVVSSVSDPPPPFPPSAQKSTILLTMHIYVFARIAIADARMFLQLMTLGAQSLGQSEGYAYEVLLDQWWSRVRLQTPLSALSPALNW
jgi:hypothetical protein